MVQIQRKYISIRVLPFLFVEVDRVGPSKKGRALVKCRKKAWRFPTLQLVRLVYMMHLEHTMSYTAQLREDREGLEMNNEERLTLPAAPLTTYKGVCV